MGPENSSNELSVQRNTITQREFLSYCFIGSIIISMVALSLMIMSIATANHYIQVGNISDYPPNYRPYPIPLDKEIIWLVNTGTEIKVFSGKAPNSLRHQLVWNDVLWAFFDPATSSSFTLEGKWRPRWGIRDMDQYEFKIDDGQILVNTSSIIWGANSCDYEGYEFDGCYRFYNQQTQYIGKTR